MAMLCIPMVVFGGRQFDRLSSRYGQMTLAQPIDEPLTIAVWARPALITQQICAVGLGASTNAVERIELGFFGAIASDPVISYSVSSAGTFAGPSSGAFVASTWQLAVAIHESSTLRKLRFGGAWFTNTTAVTLQGLDIVYVGTRKNTTLGNYWDGQLAEAAVWTVALTPDEVTSLESGAAPYLIRPQSLLFYAPMTGRETATEINIVGPIIGMSNSPPASTEHPRIYRP